MSELLPEWRLAAVEQASIDVLAQLLGDPNVVHVDAEAVRALGLGDATINQGPANIAYLMNMLAAAFPGSRLRRIETRLQGNVFAGDAVRAGGRIARTVAGPPHLVHCNVWLDRVGGDRVVVGTATVELVQDSSR